MIEIRFGRLRLNIADLRILAVPDSKVWISCLSLLWQYSNVDLLFSLGFGEPFEKFRKGRIVGFLTSIPALGD
jgi:hypothetical protein